MRPVNAPITSGFGMRYHPILHITRLHAGVDFGASIGTPVRCAGPGEVVAAQRMSGFGNVVIVDHGGGITTVVRPPLPYRRPRGSTDRAGADARRSRDDGPRHRSPSPLGGPRRRPCRKPHGTLLGNLGPSRLARKAHEGVAFPRVRWPRGPDDRRCPDARAGVRARLSSGYPDRVSTPWIGRSATDRPRAIFPVELPATMGSEFSGTIERLGDGIEGYAVGDDGVRGSARSGSCADYVVREARDLRRRRRRRWTSPTQAASLSRR